jgi:hypothetical protein
MSREGGKEAHPAGAAEAVPTSSSPADREPPPAVCLACLPSAAAPRPRPLRCGLLFPEHGESRPRWRMS